MSVMCSKMGHWYCFAEYTRRTISRLDTLLRGFAKDSLERDKSRQKHIGQQPTQCKRLSDVSRSISAVRIQKDRRIQVGNGERLPQETNVASVISATMISFWKSAFEHTKYDRPHRTLIDCSAILRVNGCTRTYRNRWLLVLVSQALANSFRHTVRCFGVRFRQKEHEFVASVSRSCVNFAAMNSENIR